jgi:excisionase family DNA binding protein
VAPDAEALLPPYPLESEISPDELLTVTQAARALGTGECFVRQLIRDRRIASVRLGRYVRIHASELDRFIGTATVPVALAFPTEAHPRADGSTIQ